MFRYSTPSGGENAPAPDWFDEGYNGVSWSSGASPSILARWAESRACAVSGFPWRPLCRWLPNSKPFSKSLPSILISKRRTCAKPCSLRRKRCVSARYRSSSVSGVADASQTTTAETSTCGISLVQTAQGRAPLETVTPEGTEGPSASASDLTGLYVAFGSALEVDALRDRPSCPRFNVRAHRPEPTPDRKST